MVSADWAASCGVVEDSDLPPIIRVVSGKALDCTGIVTFDVESGGKSMVVSAWVSPLI